jgi:protein disulfide-isomerase A1
MDAADNDLPSGLPFKIEGFPTIKLFKAKTNEIIEYEGERELDGFISFLEKNAEHYEQKIVEKEDSHAEEKPSEVTPKEEQKKESETDKGHIEL